MNFHTDIFVLLLTAHIYVATTAIFYSAPDSRRPSSLRLELPIVSSQRKGDPNYDIPDTVNLNNYQSANIGCAPFGVNFCTGL